MSRTARGRLLRAGVWASAGGLVGTGLPVIDPGLTASSAFALGAAATALGIGIDSSEDWLLSKFDGMVQSPFAIRRKLRSDFANSPLRNWTALESALQLVVYNLSRAKLAEPQDRRLESMKRLKLLKDYLALSNCWDGRPLPTSIKVLQENGPFVVNASSHNTGLQVALIRMVEDFGIPLKIDDQYWHGVEQINGIDNGNYADFAIVVDANVFLAGVDRMAKEYRLLIPCCLQKHKIVRRRTLGKFDHSLIWFADGTSAEEQIRLRKASGRIERPTEERRIDISEIVRKIEELNCEEGVIAWEPLITLHGLARNFVVEEAPNYQFSTSLYCHKKLLSIHNVDVLNAFQDCLLAAWNLGRIYEVESFARLLLGSNCRENFNRIKAMTEPSA